MGIILLIVLALLLVVGVMGLLGLFDDNSEDAVSQSAGGSNNAGGRSATGEAGIFAFTAFGRLGRKEYWSFIVFYILASVVTYLVGGFFRYELEEAYQQLAYLSAAQQWFILLTYGLGFIVAFVFAIYLAIQWALVTIRRLHDLNVSGGWCVLIFIPLVGLIFSITIGILRGEEKENRFGKPLSRTS